MADRTLQGHRTQYQGFTIVELLIVIVVIAVLAAIATVAYNGITNRAKVAAVSSSLLSLKKKIEIFRTTDAGQHYPGDLSTISIPNSSTQFRYAANNVGNPYGFCLDGTQNGVTYYITEAPDAPKVGKCDETYGLAGWWKLNGSSADAGPFGWGTSSSNSPSSAVGQNGQAGNALSFNGTNQYVYVPTFNTATISYGAVSLSGWVYPQNNPAADQGYFGVRATGAAPQYYVLQKAGTNTLECRVWPTGAGASVDAGSISVTPNTWNFIALIFNGESAQCYVNGVGSAATPVSGTFNFTSNYFTIGRVGTTGSAYFNGRIDDVRTYTRILSTDEIQSMYSAGAQ